MAEAIVNAKFDETWQAFSAGTHPTGSVHPKALQVLNEIGIRHTGRSKGLDEFQGQDFDLVVTVCDAAAEECPVWFGKGKRLHRGFPDPAKAVGTEQEVLNAFRYVRDKMLAEVPLLLTENIKRCDKRRSE